MASHPSVKYSWNVDGELIILESAHDHGVSDEDIFHALRHEHHHAVQDDGMVMFIGPDYSGTLIEVGLVEWWGMIAVPHAMCPAREKYLRQGRGA